MKKVKVKMTKEQKIEYIISSLEKELMDYKGHHELKNFVAEAKESLEAKDGFSIHKISRQQNPKKVRMKQVSRNVKIEKASPKTVARYVKEMRCNFMSKHIIKMGEVSASTSQVSSFVEFSRLLGV